MEQIGLSAILDLSEFDRNIARYLSGLDKMDNANNKMAGQFGKAFDDMGQGVLRVAGLLSGALVAGAVAAGAAIGAFTVNGIKKAADLESKMGAIAAVMGETKDAIEPLKKLILDLGMDPTLKVNATEAADAIEKLASNGLTMTQIMDGAAKSTVLLANSTGADFDTAAAVATDSMILFNIEASNMQQAVDAITGVTVASKFSINDYRLALAQAGGVASAAGVEFSDYNAVIASISNYFASGSDAGTSYKTMLQRLVPQSNEASDAMKALGLEFFDANGNMKSMAQISTELNDAFAKEITFTSTVSNLTDEQAARKKKLEQTIQSLTSKLADYQSGIAGVAQSENDKVVAVDRLNRQLVAAQAEYANYAGIQATTTSTTRALTEEEKNHYLSVIFGTDAMRAAVAMSEQGEVAYTDLTEASKALGVSVDELAQFAEGGITKFEAMLVTIGKTDAVESAKVRMDNFKGSMEILQGVIDTVALKIGFAFLPMLKEMADRLSEFISAHADQIVGFFEGFAAAIESLVSGSPWQEVFPVWLVGTIETIANNMDILMGALGGIAALLASAGIAAAFTAIGAAMAGLLSPMALLIGGAAALGVAWNTNFLGLRDTTLTVLAAVTSAFAPLTTAIQEFGTGALAEITKFATGNETEFTNLKAIWDGAVQSVQNLFSGIIDAVQSNLPIWKAQLAAWGSSVVNVIMSVDYKSIGVNILTLIRDGWNATTSAVLPVVSAFAANIKTKFNEIDWKAVGVTILTYIRDGWEATKATVLTGLGVIVTSFKERFGETANNWTAAGKDILDRVRAGIESAKETALATITTVVADMRRRYVTPDGFAWGTIGTDIMNAIRDGLQQAAQAAGGILATVVTVATFIKDQFTKQSWDEIGATIMNAIRDGLDAAAKAAGGLLVIVKNIGLDLMTAFTEINWEEVGRTMARLLKDGFKALAEGAGGLLPTAKTVGTGVFDAFANIDWLELGRTIISAVGAGVKAVAYAAGGLIYIVSEIVEGFTEELFSVDWQTLGGDIIALVQDGVEGARTAILNSVRTLLLDMKKIFTDLADTWKNIGMDIVNGIGAGITAAKDSLVKKAQDLANSLPGWVKEILGISSPSKVFAEIGRNVVEGLIVGIENQLPQLQEMTNKMANTLTSSEIMGIQFSATSDFSDRLKEKYLQPLLDLNKSIKARQSELQNTLAALHTEYFSMGVSDGRKLEIVSMINRFTQELTNLAKSDVSGKLRDLQLVLTAGGNIRDNNSFLQSQIALFEEAKKLGVDVSGIGVGDDNIDNVMRMAAVEQRITELKNWQLRLTARQVQAQTKQIEQYQNMRDALAQVEGVNDFMSDQLALMKKAEGLGLNLSELWSGGIIRDSGSPEDTQRILSLQLRIASATGAALENQMATMIAEQRRAQGLEMAMRQLQPLIDQTNVSSAFGQKYKAEVLDPMLRALQQSAGIDAERVRLMNEYTAAAQKLIEINKKEEQLGFLQKQLDIVKMIADQDLVGGASLFDGIAFGVNASIDDLLTLTNRVLNAMITEVKDELGIHSPSRVFADIGSQMMNGLSQGIQRSFVQPLNALRQSTVAHGAVSTRTLNFAMGGVTINTPMDEVRFESRVLRILERSMN